MKQSTFPESGADQIGTQKLRNRIAFNEVLYTPNDVSFPNVVDIMDDRDVDLDDADAVVTFWMERLFPDQYDDVCKQLAVDFLEADDDGEAQELDSTATGYAQRIRKFLAFISAYPQHQEQ